MSQYLITIQDNQAGVSFIEFVKNLNFVVNVEALQVQEHSSLKLKQIPLPKKNGNFKELFGIWKDYPVTIEQIRTKAWPRKEL
jgi:hypothetical protein